MAVNKTKLKKQIFDIIQIGDKSNLASRAFDIFIVGVILSNISVMFLQTYDQLEPYYGLLSVIEWVTTGIFCVEYILRIWTADFLYPTCTRGKAIGKFLISYDGVVDLLTIIPVFFLSGFVAFRMLRVIRIFHLFRINSKYDSFNVIKMVLLRKSRQIISSMFIIFILMMASSLCMYSTEHAAQPGVFSNAFSGIWWAVSTVLTRGVWRHLPDHAAGQMHGDSHSIYGSSAGSDTYRYHKRRICRTVSEQCQRGVQSC